MDAKQILLALSYKNQGQWESIYNDLEKKNRVTGDDYHLAEKNTKSSYFSIIDDVYPDGLKEVAKPPILLYYYGNLSLLRYRYRLTVVGSRRPTLYQNNIVYSFISECEEKLNNELVIISGMAKGIDQAGMKAAMDRNAPVISVIGSGIDNPYPDENDGIYEYCKSGKGLVISEYPGMLNAKPDNFVMRNRILAGLSMLTFVGAGKQRSGTVVTVRHSIDKNNEILALPCNTTGDDFTNILIKEGATSVLTSNDLLEAIHARYDIFSKNNS